MNDDLSTAIQDVRFPWYELVDNNDLEQGDIFEQCPVFTIGSPFSYEDYCAPNFKAQFENWELNVIVMTQSCDLTKNYPKVDDVLICPLWDLEKLAEQLDYVQQTKGKEDIRRGNVPGYHMLHASNLPDFSR